jgi:hypothetical protein
MAARPVHGPRVLCEPCADEGYAKSRTVGTGRFEQPDHVE